jgi:hypothetical protein
MMKPQQSNAATMNATPAIQNTCQSTLTTPTSVVTTTGTMVNSCI